MVAYIYEYTKTIDLHISIKLLRKIMDACSLL